MGAACDTGGGMRSGIPAEQSRVGRAAEEPGTGGIGALGSKQAGDERPRAQNRRTVPDQLAMTGRRNVVFGIVKLLKQRLDAGMLPAPPVRISQPTCRQQE